MFLGILKLGDNLTFYANTFTPDTGACVDADAVPSYEVYEEETATAICIVQRRHAAGQDCRCRFFFVHFV